MNSLNLPPTSNHAASSHRDGAARYARLGQTRLFRDGGLDRWLNANITVIGGGNTGGQTAIHLAQSGANVTICDPQFGEEVNLGTQRVTAGVAKAVAVANACSALRAGSSTAFVGDVRLADMRRLSQASVIIDCSDDPKLAVWTNRVSNGLGIPLVRVAIDGGGEAELARVLVSHGGAGHACGMCSWGPGDFLALGSSDAHCPAIPGEGPPSTVAGSAIGGMAAAAGVLAAQKLVTGVDVQTVIDREVYIDMNNLQMLNMELKRSDNCLGGHESWNPVPAGLNAASATLLDLFALAEQQLPADGLSIELFGNPIATHASCLKCGTQQASAGSVRGVGPACPVCGAPMAWLDEFQIPAVSREDVASQRIGDIPLVRLGMPESGALVVAHAPDRPPLRLLLE